MKKSTFKNFENGSRKNYRGDPIYCRFLFFFCGIPFIISSLVGKSPSGFVFIQIVFSIETAGLLFKTAFTITFSSVKFCGITSSLPSKVADEQLNCISLFESGIHLPLDSLPSTLI